MIRKLLVFFVCLICSGSLFGGNVRISGCESSYAGLRLSLLTYQEYITYQEKILAEGVVDTKGCFTLEFSLENTSLIFFHLGKYFAYLYAEPGKQYTVKLPVKADKTEADQLNPYFTEEEIHLVPSSEDLNDLNHLIARFDSLYGPYYNQFALSVYGAPDPASADTAVQTLIQEFEGIRHPYFSDYLFYKTGILRCVASQYRARSLSAIYFRNHPVLFENPAYMELFHRVYDSYFTYFGRTDAGKAIYEIVNKNQSYSALRKILSSDKVFQGDTLRDLVILKNLHDEFYSNSFNRNAIIQVLDSFRLQGTVIQFRPVAENILKKVTRLMAGYPPPAFHLQDRDGNLKSLDDFKGRYVYLNFCYCSSYSCLKEFEMLNTLYGKFKNYFEIVTVLADPTLQKVTDFLNQNEYSWTFLHYGRQPDILKDYDIRAFPTYFLIGPDGRLILSPAPSPGENFQQTIFNIMRSRGDI